MSRRVGTKNVKQRTGAWYEAYREFSSLAVCGTGRSSLWPGAGLQSFHSRRCKITAVYRACQHKTTISSVRRAKMGTKLRNAHIYPVETSNPRTGSGFPLPDTTILPVVGHAAVRPIPSLCRAERDHNSNPLCKPGAECGDCAGNLQRENPRRSRPGSGTPPATLNPCRTPRPCTGNPFPCLIARP